MDEETSGPRPHRLAAARRRLRSLAAGEVIAIAITIGSIVGALVLPAVHDRPTRAAGSSSDAAGKDHASPARTAWTRLTNSQLVIDGARYSFHDGQARVPAAPGSATVSTARVLATHLAGDFDGDHTVDLAALVVLSTGGSGIFTYLVAYSGDTEGPTAVQYLGDRIEFPTLSAANHTLTVHYRDRRAGTPFSAPADKQVTRRFRLAGHALATVRDAA